MADEDVEVTLGTGKLLGLFFGMVVVCAIFFGLGYSMGKSAAPAGSLVPEAGAVAVPGGTKPTAAKPTSMPAPETVQAASPSPSPSQADLTFYKSTEQKQATPKLVPAEQKPAPAAEKPAPAPEMHSGAGYVVQVAAVTKQEDADLLADALRKKSYPVFVMGTANDKLIRVQIGPFADLKQAEDMKTKLAGDGYNAIVKK